MQSLLERKTARKPYGKTAGKAGAKTRSENPPLGIPQFTPAQMAGDPHAPPTLSELPGCFYCEHEDPDLMQFVGFVTVKGARMAEYFCHHCQGSEIRPA